MSKHTPGSWQVASSNPSQVRIDGFRRLIADCTTLKASWHQENLANARLISAAPELLSVCKELAESAAYWGEYDVPVGIVERLNAAIAKAEGAA